MYKINKLAHYYLHIHCNANNITSIEDPRSRIDEHSASPLSIQSSTPVQSRSTGADAMAKDIPGFKDIDGFAGAGGGDAMFSLHSDPFSATRHHSSAHNLTGSPGCHSDLHSSANDTNATLSFRSETDIDDISRYYEVIKYIIVI